MIILITHSTITTLIVFPNQTSHPHSHFILCLASSNKTHVNIIFIHKNHKQKHKLITNGQPYINKTKAATVMSFDQLYESNLEDTFTKVSCRVVAELFNEKRKVTGRTW